MKINSIITQMMSYHKGIWHGKRIDSATSRDKVLFGNVNQACSGIVTTCWASIDVIRKAEASGANLIICHEALFWNHGDKTNWLNSSQNLTYFKKIELLKKYNMVVWRDHDYVHSGIPMPDGTFIDGIFYGFAKELGWEKYIIPDDDSLIAFRLPSPSTSDNIAHLLVDRFHLQGARIIGSPNSVVQKIDIPSHIFGNANTQIIKADQNKFDLFITLELIDYTLSEYIKDSSELYLNKTIIAIGHFNVEEAGMKYMSSYITSVIGNEIPCRFIQSGDLYNYIV